MGLPVNFSFVLEGRLAGSGHPGHGVTFESALRSLREQGIYAILNLTERQLDLSVIRKFEFNYLHVPIDDFTAPTQKKIDEAVAFLAAQDELETGVLVHCQAGIGRTGTILACYLVYRGMDAAEAIRTVRNARPGSLEVYSQEFSVYEYAKRLGRGSRHRRGNKP